MIYITPLADDPIQQGDIFRGVPRVDIALDSLSLIEDGEQIATTWHDIITADDPSHRITAVLPIKRVLAIVITQNCDAVRSPTLALCEITDYLSEAERASPPRNPKAWMSRILKTIIQQPSVFYLPPGTQPELSGKKAVDFRSVVRLLRTDLENLRQNRIARLNNVAYEHFRETLAQFFRRYPVNGWYPLDHEEFEAYAASQPTEQIEPYPWQRQPSA